MAAQDFIIPKLFQRDWFLAKITDILKSDPYLKHLDWKAILENLDFCLNTSSTFEEGLKKFEEFDFKDRLEFSRKLDTTSGNLTVFTIPNLSFQIRSVLGCWPDIVNKYSKLPKLAESLHFGHRPNTETYRPFLNNKETVRDIDMAINSPLKIKFQDQYDAFKSVVIGHAKKSIRENDANKFSLIIQSDIKSFFHNLTPASLIKSIKKIAPDLSCLIKYLEELQSKNYTELPIGWALSGIIVDRLLSEFHGRIEKELVHYGKKHKLHNIKFNTTVNYVDDFFFLFSFERNEDFEKNEDEKENFEKTTCEDIFKIATDIINELFSVAGLKFYEHGSEKCQILYFNFKNFDILDSNFHSLIRAGAYDEQDSTLAMFADLDDKMLPADNDLILNERAYFNVLLHSFKRRVVDGGNLERSEVEEFFKKTQNKFTGTEKKYVVKVIEILETLAFLDKDEYFEFSIEQIKKIFDTLVTNQTSFEIWLKFFNRLFVFFSRSDYDKRIVYMPLFYKFVTYWQGRTQIAKDDLFLLGSISNLALFKRAINKELKFKIVESRRILRPNPLLNYEVQKNTISFFSKSKAFNKPAAVISVLKSSLFKIEKTQDKVIFVSEMLKFCDNRDQKSYVLMRVVSYMRPQTVEEVDYILKKMKSSFVSDDYVKLTAVKSTISKLLKYKTYEEKLRFVRSSNYFNSVSSIKTCAFNKSKTQAKDISSKLIFLFCHDQRDLIFCLLQNTQVGYRSRLVDRGGVPATFKSIGLGFYKILMILSKQLIIVNSGKLVNSNNFFNELNQIVIKELKFYNTKNKLEAFKRENVCFVNLDEVLNLDKKRIKKKSGLLH